ncbi:MAG: hypothetical protein ACYC4J_06705 [Gemmatimonadaceae bacterium]
MDQHTRPDGSQRPAEHAGDRLAGVNATRAERGRGDATLNEPPGGLENPQTALGGADAVQKASTIVGKGMDPDAAGGVDARREREARED